MKRTHASLIIGLVLLLATPIIIIALTTNIHQKSSATVSTGNDTELRNDLDLQLNRANKLSRSKKYDAAQKLTLQLKYQEYLNQSEHASNKQLSHLTSKLKVYLDKDKFAYSVTPSNQIVAEVSQQNRKVHPETSQVLVFNTIDKPQLQKLSIDGYTILNKRGEKTSGEISMWIDKKDKLHLDTNFAETKNGIQTINVLENTNKK